MKLACDMARPRFFLSVLHSWNLLGLVVFLFTKRFSLQKLVSKSYWTSKLTQLFFGFDIFFEKNLQKVTIFHFSKQLFSNLCTFYSQLIPSNTSYNICTRYLCGILKVKNPSSYEYNLNIFCDFFFFFLILLFGKQYCLYDILTKIYVLRMKIHVIYKNKVPYMRQ